MNAPPLTPGASFGQRAHRAKKELLTPLGLPAALPPDWEAAALSLDLCVRCGACADKWFPSKYRAPAPVSPLPKQP